MFVNYDSSSESENEEPKQNNKQEPQKQPVNESKQPEEIQKKKVKLLNFNQIMKKSDEKTYAQSSSYTQNLINETRKIESQKQEISNKEAQKDINTKRKLPQSMEEKIECPTENKYHKLNEKQEEIQQKQQDVKNQKINDNTIKTKQNKVLFIPPQARNNKGNVSTEY